MTNTDTRSMILDSMRALSAKIADDINRIDADDFTDDDTDYMPARADILAALIELSTSIITDHDNYDDALAYALAHNRFDSIIAIDFDIPLDDHPDIAALLAF